MRGYGSALSPDYQLHVAREAEAQRAEKSVQWAKRFPVNELVKRGSHGKGPSSDTDMVAKLLSFFGVCVG